MHNRTHFDVAFARLGATKPAVVLAGFLLLACGGSAPPPQAASSPEACEPVGLEVALSPGEALNGTSPADARPVQVRLYLLKSEGALKGASFEDVWQRDKEALGEDLVSSSELTVYPGTRKVVPVKPEDGAEFLGVVAIFREPQEPGWHVVYPLPAPEGKPPCPNEPPRFELLLDRMEIVEDTGGRPSGQ